MPRRRLKTEVAVGDWAVEVLSPSVRILGSTLDTRVKSDPCVVQDGVLIVRSDGWRVRLSASRIRVIEDGVGAGNRLLADISPPHGLQELLSRYEH